MWVTTRAGSSPSSIRRRPYSVLLFDEIEKAHPEVFNVLLQLLDDGRLTDGHGRTVDFRNSVVIMTSNLGNELWMGASVSGDPVSGDNLTRDTVSRDTVIRVLQAHFRPEFLNRIDEIVIFHPLTRQHLAEIVAIQLRLVTARLAERGFTLEVSEAAREYLAEVGYDPDFGARPLKRAIQRELQDPLALAILSGEFREGDIVQVDRGPEGLTFTTLLHTEVVEE